VAVVVGSMSVEARSGRMRAEGEKVAANASSKALFTFSEFLRGSARRGESKRPHSHFHCAPTLATVKFPPHLNSTHQQLRSLVKKSLLLAPQPS
jgi:hypothetical protein